MGTKEKNPDFLEKKNVLTSILNFVSKHTGVSVEDMKGPVRKRQIVVARQIYCFFTKKYLRDKVNLSDIGALINRDHSTVIHSAKTLENLCESDKILNALVSEMMIDFEPIKNDIIRGERFLVVPKNAIQSERARANKAIMVGNQIYYECLKHLKHHNESINKDPLIEGFKKVSLNIEYKNTLRELNVLKMKLD